jgi:putative phosphoribosyl transferase
MGKAWLLPRNQRSSDGKPCEAAMQTETVAEVEVPVGSTTIKGDWRTPKDPVGSVIVVHARDVSPFGTLDRDVAGLLGREGYATLLLNLLTPTEAAGDSYALPKRFDIDRLGHRLCAAVDWIEACSELRDLPLGCFAAGYGTAAALVAAAERPASLLAVVAQAGRPDLAAPVLARVEAPTLLIVGSLDETIIEMNQLAMAQMTGIVELEIVPDATVLLEESSTRDRVAARAVEWFRQYLTNPGAATSIVPVGEWSTFVQAFNRRHRGWLTFINTTTGDGRSHEFSIARPLDSIEVVRNAGRISAFEVRFQDTMSPRSVVVLAPHIVRVDETARGAEQGLDVEDRYGRRTRIRFRATARPEEMDGIAAAEL